MRHRPRASRILFLPKFGRYPDQIWVPGFYPDLRGDYTFISHSVESRNLLLDSWSNVDGGRKSLWTRSVAFCSVVY